MQISEAQEALALQYAAENHKEHNMSCSESVFNALIRSGIIDLPEDMTALATGFSGGVAASGNTCGAIYGGLLALGWVYGRKNPFNGTMATSTAEQEKDYRFNLLRRFNCYVHEMEEQIGTTRCADIIHNSGGYFDNKRIMKCPNIIVTSVKTTIKYLRLTDAENRQLPFGQNILGFK